MRTYEIAITLKELKTLWRSWNPDDPLPRENKAFFYDWADEMGLLDNVK